MTGGRRSRGIGAVRLVGVGLALLGLSACTHDHPPPDPSPTVTASAATALPSPTVTPPTAPKAAPTQKSAEAFVRYFWDVYNYSYTTRDAHALQEISQPGCVFCKSTSKAIRDLVKNDETIKGSKISLKVAAAPPTNPLAGLIVATIISESPGQTLSANGSIVSRTSGVRNMKSEIAVDWTGKRWLVRDLANDEKTGVPW